MSRVAPNPASAAQLSLPCGDELSRLTALYGSGLLEEGPQEALDALVALAANMLGCPAAMLSLVDRDLVHMRSTNVGPLGPVPRGEAMCDCAIRCPEGLVIPDLADDERFLSSVDAGLRFYAGVPIHARDDTDKPRPIGALCVTDTTPRQLDDTARAALRQIAAVADVLIAARVDAQRAVAIATEHNQLVGDLARQHRIFAQAERMTAIGSWRLSLVDEALEWSEGVFRIYGLPSGSPPLLAAALDPYPHEARGRVSAALAHAIEHCASFDFEEDFRPFRDGAPGELRRVRCIGECEQVDGHNVALVGVFQDVTDRHRLETALRHDADTDGLTGLANRAAFDKRLEAAITRARTEQTPLALALIDLDGFKAVNDTMGHAAGDDVLRDVAKVLHGLPFKPLLAARIGGDEFALLIDDPALAEDHAALRADLEHALIVPITREGLTLSCSGSVGIAMLDEIGNARDFVHRADVALYAVKRARIGERRRGDRRKAA